MRTNKAKAKIRAGEKVYGLSFSFPWLHAIEMAGVLGFDYIFIDGEHGVFTHKDIEEMCMMADRMGITPIARVPNIMPSTILGYLDRGVMGILGPHIVTRADAEALVRACKFAPKGVRSFAGPRVMEYSAPADASQLMAQANDETLVLALIEDADAIKNLPEILKVEGLDILSFGPFDLSQSMGYPGQRSHPKVVEAMEKAAAQIRASGKKFGGDVMMAVGVTELIMTGARDFLAKAKARK